MKNFLIYRSSAGSGKTYTLVKEYLKLVLSDPEGYKNTLAVTFTNKAAEEMKSRIIQSLILLSQDKEPELKKILTNEGVKADIALASNDVLTRILHNYSYFSVSTFDSFFLRVVRSFARDLRLHPGYTIEIETDMVLDKVVDEVFDMIGEDKKLTRYMTEYIFQNIDEDKGWQLERNIKNLAKEIFRERYLEKAGNLLDSRDEINEFGSTLFSIKKDFENNMQTWAQQACEIIKTNGLNAWDFKHKDKGVTSYLTKMANPKNYVKIQKLTKRAKDTAMGLEEWCLPGSLKKKIIDKAVNEGLGKLLSDMVNCHETNLKKYMTARVLLKTIYTIGIFADIIDKIKLYRDENKVFLISDLNNILKNVITEGSSPFVYEMIGSYYKNFLVDEFQDTSEFQWHNLLPLILNSLSEQNFSMVVGDVKQSIYRWRNGNMMLLLRGIEADLSQFSDIIKKENLGINYRSKSEIVEFNNYLFKKVSDTFAQETDTGNSEIITEAYNEIKQEYKENNTGGYIRVEFIPNTKPSMIEQPEADQKTPFEIAGERMVEIINQLVKEGIKARDIMVLSRRVADIREAAMLITKVGYNVVSEESLLLTNSPKVKLLTSLFKYIIDRKNRFAKKGALYNYVLLIKQDEVEAEKVFRHSVEDNFFVSLMPRELFSSVSDEKLDPNLYRLGLYELTETLIRIFELNKQPDLYLTRFLDVILEFITIHSQDVTSFLTWWEENNKNYCIVVPEQENAIRAMTIHKAKGLQSPIVIIPYANWDTEMMDYFWASSSASPFDKSSAYLVRGSRDLKESYFEEDYSSEFVMTKLDNLNLMYVAFTRAAERLYVISPERNIYIKDINKYLTGFFNSDGWLQKHKTGENIYEFGLPGKISAAEKQTKTEIINAPAITASDFHNRIVIKPVHENISLEYAESYQTAHYRGIILHKALSLIRTKKDVPGAVAKLAAQGLIEKNKTQEFEKEITGIIEHKDTS
ncbi:MAG TPA: UvrD-helicase domain-containing protein, partial [Ignavibacteria bacterium]